MHSAREEATESIRSAKKTGARIWIVDPIDGTRGFAMKNGEFSVMIGFMVDNEIEIGVVAEPALDRVTYATRGGGCWSTIGKFAPTPCRVTSAKTLSESTLVRSHAKPGRPDPVGTALKPLKCVETYSGGVKLAMVARGEVDLYVNDYSRFADWDICRRNPGTGSRWEGNATEREPDNLLPARSFAIRRFGGDEWANPRGNDLTAQSEKHLLISGCLQGRSTLV